MVVFFTAGSQGAAMTPGIGLIVGKTISGIIVRRGAESPRNQSFLLFDDGTAYEIWTDDYLGLGSEPDAAGAEQIKQRLRQPCQIAVWPQPDRG
jgi:hypothetical protein